MQLRVAEQYVGQPGALAKAGNTLVLPATVSDVGAMLALAMNVIGRRVGEGAGVSARGAELRSRAWLERSEESLPPTSASSGSSCRGRD
ncbi:MAG TPA: band-7 C-terminal domain-containing protein [Candidatus Limnocylindria bacterium]|nr:band-7 C-terminal domain-containing protein [Candidatus Limnocylindria bacterium]